MATNKRAGNHAAQQNDFLAPKAPISVSATNVGTNRGYNNGAANLVVTPDNTNPITAYRVVAYFLDAYGIPILHFTGNDVAAVFGTTQTITVEGLYSANNYVFYVYAINASGSAISPVSNTVTITTVPDVPTGVSATSPTYATYDTVSWIAPNNGGSAITNYHVMGNDGTSGDTSATSINIAQNAGEIQAYTVYATNANGNSATSIISNDVQTFSFVPFGVFGFSPFTVFSFSPFLVFQFSPFGVFSFSPFGVFGFSPFRVFSFFR
jgi:hypothetical protein